MFKKLSYLLLTCLLILGITGCSNQSKDPFIPPTTDILSFDVATADFNATVDNPEQLELMQTLIKNTEIATGDYNDDALLEDDIQIHLNTTDSDKDECNNTFILRVVNNEPCLVVPYQGVYSTNCNAFSKIKEYVDKQIEESMITIKLSVEDPDVKTVYYAACNNKDNNYDVVQQGLESVVRGVITDEPLTIKINGKNDKFDLDHFLFAVRQSSQEPNYDLVEFSPLDSSVSSIEFKAELTHTYNLKLTSLGQLTKVD